MNAPTEAAPDSAEAIRDRLMGTNNGLEVRRWTVREQGDSVVRALTRHADGAAADEQTLSRLQMNGFYLARVPQSDLEALLAEMGGASYDGNEWNGQVYDWRPLLQVAVSPEGRAIAIDGQVARYADGEFRLVFRGWTVQMEDGPYMHLEAVPRRHFEQSNNLRKLLGTTSDADQGFSSMAIDLQLQGGFAYVLVGDSPQANWLPGVGANASQPSSAPDARPPSTRGGFEDFYGPDAAAPPTLGELLLPAGGDPHLRSVLVFVPKIPRTMFLDEQLAAIANQTPQTAQQ